VIPKNVKNLVLCGYWNHIIIFHLGGKTLDFKKVLIHFSFRFNKGVDRTLIYPDPTQTQQQYQSFIKHLGFGFFKALDHT